MQAVDKLGRMELHKMFTIGFTEMSITYQADRTWINRFFRRNVIKLDDNGIDLFAFGLTHPPYITVGINVMDVLNNNGMARWYWLTLFEVISIPMKRSICVTNPTLKRVSSIKQLGDQLIL